MNEQLNSLRDFWGRRKIRKCRIFCSRSPYSLRVAARPIPPKGQQAGAVLACSRDSKEMSGLE
jgi:hypothetical protein